MPFAVPPNTISATRPPTARVLLRGRRSLRLAGAALALLCVTSTGRTAQESTNPWLPYSPTGYYLYLLNCCGAIANWDRVRLDAGGIPTITYDGGLSYQYYPVTIELFGLQAYTWYLKYGTQDYLDNAVRAGDWLVDNQVPWSGEWLSRFTYYAGGSGSTLNDPWPSAMAQGLGMSLLTRLAIHTGDPKYLKAAEAALDSLKTPVAKGGVLAKFFRHPFYEEYPTNPPTFTLNGFMYTLIGLYDLEKAAPRTEAGRLYAQGLATLRYALPFYDLSTTSSYHLSHITNPLRPAYTLVPYHQVHVMLLRALSSVTPDPTLAYYADLWGSYPPCAGSPTCDP
jgi:hypothetical protein